jgi:hypothetical protein
MPKHLVVVVLVAGLVCGCGFTRDMGGWQKEFWAEKERTSGGIGESP